MDIRAVGVGVIVAGLCASPTAAQEMRPFVIPWDDASATATDLSGWNHRPAGTHGPVRVGEDGHLYVGDERIRFWGVNVGPETVFTEVENEADYDAFAAHLAKFGFNAVRFHHLGADWSERNIFGPRPREKTTEVDAESFDRFARWVDALKRHGLYTNLNLLVSRRFTSADGLPAEIDRVAWKTQGVVAIWHPRMIELQRVYARQMLATPNPHTGMPLAEDPALAFVEINNEAGLIHAWYGGQMDDLPQTLTLPLRERWRDYLRERYGEQAVLEAAWGVKDQPLGEEMLTDGAAPKPEAWRLERHQGAAAQLSAIDGPDGGEAARVTVDKPGTQGWHVQLGHPGLTVEAGALYTLSFRARADRARTISAGVRQAHDPWGALGLQESIEVGPAWKDFAFTFIATAADDNARVIFGNLSQAAARFDFAGVSLRPGGRVGLPAGASLEAEAFPLPARSATWGTTLQMRRDWLDFLRAVERDYWTGMRRFIRDELGVTAPVIGTIASCSPLTVQAEMDAIDTHAYWQHPHFPGRPWDPANWIVGNASMVNHEAGGNVTQLAMCAVAGKPHIVSEYDHPAPNPHAAEAAPLLAAYAGLQDWDGVFLFAYGGERDAWDRGRFSSFFDWMAHPTKLANTVPAAALFLRGDVAPAKKTVVRRLTTQEELDILATRTGAWSLVNLAHLGVDRLAALRHRTRVALGDDAAAADEPEKPADDARRVSDTGELTWDARREGKGVVLIDTPRSKGVIGFGDGRTFELGPVTITPGPTRLGWCTVLVTLMEGESFEKPRRALLTLTGDVANTGMQWQDEAHTTVGTAWGERPSVVEAAPATVTLPKGVRVYALDERGGRAGEVPVHEKGDAAEVKLGPPHAMLWYEAVWE